MSLYLIIFLVFIISSLAFGIYSFFILYHLIRFAIGTRPKQIALIYFIGSGILFLFLAISFFLIDPQVLQEAVKQIKI